MDFPNMSSINKVVLAYSGGLDTSVIVRWLQDTYGCEVVTFTAEEVSIYEAGGVLQRFAQDFLQERAAA